MSNNTQIEVLRASLKVMQAEIEAGAVPLRLLDITTRMTEIILEVNQDQVVDHEVAKLEAGPLLDLTNQESNIARRIVWGMTNREIGEDLGIVHGTVKIHVRNILTKNGLVNRTQLAARTRVQMARGMIATEDTRKAVA